MNFKELEYLITLEEEKNVTKAANKLYITPSALNQHLHKLEYELSVPLFSRTSDGWLPTEAGVVYLDASKRILNLQKNAYNMIADISDKKNSHLSIGIPPDRGTSMFSFVYPIFNEEYPNVTINLIEQKVSVQQELVKNGTIDFAFVTLVDSQKTNNSYIHIKDEEMYLAVPSTSPINNFTYKQDGEQYPFLDLKHLENELFAMIYKGSTFRHCVDEILAKEGVTPNVLIETSSISTLLNLVEAGMCCSIVNLASVNKPLTNVNIYCLHNRPKWQIYATYKKGNHLTKPAQRFIELATEYWLTH